jgi:hypothetical protein
VTKDITQTNKTIETEKSQNSLWPVYIFMISVSHIWRLDQGAAICTRACTQFMIELFF